MSEYRDFHRGEPSEHKRHKIFSCLSWEKIVLLEMKEIYQSPEPVNVNSVFFAFAGAKAVLPLNY